VYDSEQMVSQESDVTNVVEFDKAAAEMKMLTDE
jgi:hypothetical protein